VKGLAVELRIQFPTACNCQLTTLSKLFTNVYLSQQKVWFAIGWCFGTGKIGI